MHAILTAIQSSKNCQHKRQHGTKTMQEHQIDPRGEDDKASSVWRFWN